VTFRSPTNTSIQRVPAADSALNTSFIDVVGNKTDTAAGDSIVSLVKSLGAGAESHVALFSGSIFYSDAAQPDDTGDGQTPGTAKQTIGASLALMSAGDAVTVKAGTYTELGLDMSLDATEMWCEIGVLIDPVSGTAMTVSGDSCRITGMHKITPAAGQIGLLISGAECHVEHGKVIGGATGVQITGAGAMVLNYAAGFQTVKAYDLQGAQARLTSCSTVGSGATYGYSISNSAHTGVLRNCTSVGHETSGYHIAAGSQNWTLLNCSSGADDGRWVDVDSANVWSGFTFDDLVYHAHAFDADGPTNENLFRIYGTVAIIKLTGHIATVLSADIGDGFLELDDGTVQIDVTDSPGPSFASLPAETFIHKIDDAGVNIQIDQSNQVRLYEDATKDGRDPTFQVTAKAGVATYLRFTYSGVGTSGVIHWHCQWQPLTEDGHVAPV